MVTTQNSIVEPVGFEPINIVGSIEPIGLLGLPIRGCGQLRKYGVIPTLKTAHYEQVGYRFADLAEWQSKELKTYGLACLSKIVASILVRFI